MYSFQNLPKALFKVKTCCKRTHILVALMLCVTRGVTLITNLKDKILKERHMVLVGLVGGLVGSSPSRSGLPKVLGALLLGAWYST